MTKAPIEFTGQPILIEFRPHLRASRGKLVGPHAGGDDVHAATFLLRRLIILDRALLRHHPELNRILAHEIFHFVWWKAPAIRRAYALLIQQEFARSIQGEMGWSADWRKQALNPVDIQSNSRRFRDYLCESFCDSSACLLLHIPRHPEITLPAAARRQRQAFFESKLAGKRLKI